MQTIQRLLAGLSLALLPTIAGAAPQLQLPQASPAASVSQAVGPATVSVNYHRPAVHERKIWGALVPLGKVWRTGANDATKIQFSDAVKVAGHEVPAGTYSFFAIPTETTWTLILNKKADQWGAFNYSADEDLLRFEVTPTACAPQEWLRYTIEPKGENAATIQLAWEKLCVEFPVEVDSEAILMARIDDAISKAKPDDAAVFLSAAKYYYDQSLAADKAMLWVDRSIAIADSYQARECKARLAARLGRKAEAIEQIEKAIELAKGKARPQYVEALGKLLAEYKAK